MNGFGYKLTPKLTFYISLHLGFTVTNTCLKLTGQHWEGNFFVGADVAVLLFGIGGGGCLDALDFGHGGTGAELAILSVGSSRLSAFMADTSSTKLTTRGASCCALPSFKSCPKYTTDSEFARCSRDVIGLL
jgi:hypothetical protein